MRAVQAQPVRRARQHGVLGMAERACLVHQKVETLVVERDPRPARKRCHHDARRLRRSIPPRVARRADVQTGLREEPINEILCHETLPWMTPAPRTRPRPASVPSAAKTP